MAGIPAGNGQREEQEFLNSRPHHLVVPSEWERDARTLLVNSPVAMTLRDAILLALHNERMARQKRDRRLARKRRQQGEG